MKGSGPCFSKQPNEVLPTKPLDPTKDILIYELLRFVLAEINYHKLYTCDESDDSVYYILNEIDETIEQICDKLNKLSIFNPNICTSKHEQSDICRMMQALLQKRLRNYEITFGTPPFIIINNIIHLNIFNELKQQKRIPCIKIAHDSSSMSQSMIHHVTSVILSFPKI